MNKILVSVLALMIGIVINGRAGNAEEWDYLIKVDFNDCKLNLLRTDNVILASYPVALPRPSKQPDNFPVIGKVVGVVFDPAWYPTAETIEFFAKHKKIALPNMVEPGSPLNAMGRIKLIIQFVSRNNYRLERMNMVIRIHGTNEPRSIGKRVSGGCIRMLNEHALELARIVEKSKTDVIFTKNQTAA